MTHEELKRRLPNASPSFIAVTCGDTERPRTETPSALVRLNIEQRPTTREAKLNKLETARLAFLRARRVRQLRIQAITLLLGEDLRFTADFTYLDDESRMVFEDTKGPHMWEDALIKLKAAARSFTEFRFIIARRDGASGWMEQEIKP